MDEWHNLPDLPPDAFVLAHQLAAFLNDSLDHRKALTRQVTDVIRAVVQLYDPPTLEHLAHPRRPSDEYSPELGYPYRWNFSVDKSAAKQSIKRITTAFLDVTSPLTEHWLYKEWTAGRLRGRHTGSVPRDIQKPTQRVTRQQARDRETVSETSTVTASITPIQSDSQLHVPKQRQSRSLSNQRGVVKHKGKFAVRKSKSVSILTTPRPTGMASVPTSHPDHPIPSVEPAHQYIAHQAHLDDSAQDSHDTVRSEGQYRSQSQLHGQPGQMKPSVTLPGSQPAKPANFGAVAASGNESHGTETGASDSTFIKHVGKKNDRPRFRLFENSVPGPSTSRPVQPGLPHKPEDTVPPPTQPPSWTDITKLMEAFPTTAGAPASSKGKERAATPPQAPVAHDQTTKDFDDYIHDILSAVNKRFDAMQGQIDVHQKHTQDKDDAYRAGIHQVATQLTALMDAFQKQAQQTAASNAAHTAQQSGPPQPQQISPVQTATNSRPVAAETYYQTLQPQPVPQPQLVTQPAPQPAPHPVPAPVTSQPPPGMFMRVSPAPAHLQHQPSAIDPQQTWQVQPTPAENPWPQPYHMLQQIHRQTSQASAPGNGPPPNMAPNATTAPNGPVQYNGGDVRRYGNAWPLPQSAHHNPAQQQYASGPVHGGVQQQHSQEQTQWQQQPPIQPYGQSPMNWPPQQQPTYQQASVTPGLAPPHNVTRMHTPAPYGAAQQATVSPWPQNIAPPGAQQQQGLAPHGAAAPTPHLQDCGDGYFSIMASEQEVKAEYERAKLMGGGDLRFRAEDIGYFDPGIKMADANGVNTYQGKTTYKHLRPFLDAIQGATTTLPDYIVRSHLSKCLRGDALVWYTNQLPHGAKAFAIAGRGLENWTKLLTAKFQRPKSEVGAELAKMEFTQADLLNDKSITTFAINVARNLQEFGYGDAARDEPMWISTIYQKLDPQFRLVVQDPADDPTMTYQRFIQLLESRAKVFKEKQKTDQRKYTAPAPATHKRKRCATTSCLRAARQP